MRNTFIQFHVSQPEWIKMEFYQFWKQASKGHLQSLSFHEWELQNENRMKSLNFELFGLFENEEIKCRIVADAININSPEEVQHIRFLSFDKQIDFSLWNDKIIEFLNTFKNKYSKTIIETDNNSLIGILFSCNFRKANSKVYLELFKDRIDLLALNKVVDSDLLLNEGLEASFLVNPTDEEYVELAGLWTILLNDMEREDLQQVFKETPEQLKGYYLDHQKLNSNYLVLALKNNQGKIIGMSNITHLNDKPVLIRQFMSGVLPSYRRKGLTTWLKASVYKTMLEKYPTVEKILTDCYSHNRSMIAINKWFGFSEYMLKTEYLFNN